MRVKLLFITGLLISLVGLLGVDLHAQDFVYKPVNPAFGGDSFNHSWLMASANAQNNHTTQTSSSSFFDEEDPVAAFADDLNRAVMDELRRRIIDEQLGSEGLEKGNYLLGDYQIEVGETSRGVYINIKDVKTGSSSQVLIPEI
ncbi:curli production assembly/transport component CsgF [Puteibacter caeruleilacunae]|nr:curli production assembly/transport component CsgF [Puteibacter caeruleilacunae]